jgi:hypothetical protein
MDNTNLRYKKSIETDGWKVEENIKLSPKNVAVYVILPITDWLRKLSKRVFSKYRNESNQVKNVQEKYTNNMKSITELKQPVTVNTQTPWNHRTEEAEDKIYRLPPPGNGSSQQKSITEYFERIYKSQLLMKQTEHKTGRRIIA